MRCGDYLKNIVTNGWWINDLPARYRNTDKCDIDRAMCYGVCDAVFIRRQIRPEMLNLYDDGVRVQRKSTFLNRGGT